MKGRLFFFVVVLVFIAACGGCNMGASEQHDAKGTDIDCEDRFSESDYAFSLGKVHEFDKEASLSKLHNDLLQENGVFQLVCLSKPNSNSTVTRTPVELYEYPDFVTVSGENSEPVLFRGRYQLFIELLTGNAEQSRQHRVSDPSVFGAFESLLLPLEFDMDEYLDDVQMTRVCIKLIEDDKETDYYVCRDGNVILDNKASAKKLSSDETAYFFAVAKAYQLAQIGSVTLMETDALPDDLNIIVEMKDKTRELPHETALLLFEFLSDDTGKNGNGPFSFRCSSHVNYSYDSMIGEALKITLSVRSAEGNKPTSEVYSIMEDGRLVKTIGWSSIYNYDGGEQICDYIYCRTCLVSESVFSVDRVLQLVDSKD